MKIRHVFKSKDFPPLMCMLMNATPEEHGEIKSIALAISGRTAHPTFVEFAVGHVAVYMPREHVKQFLACIALIERAQA